MDYLAGFGNYFQTECMPNVILPGHNSPQKVPYGLYAEQISGSAFTLPRHLNARSWLYRLLPSVKHQEFKLLSQEKIQTAPTPKPAIKRTTSSPALLFAAPDRDSISASSDSTLIESPPPELTLSPKFVSNP